MTLLNCNELFFEFDTQGKGKNVEVCDQLFFI